MATHSSILAWRIPWTKEPGGLQSTGSQRVRHNGATLLSTIPLYTEEWNYRINWQFCLSFCGVAKLFPHRLEILYSLQIFMRIS